MLTCARINDDDDDDDDDDTNIMLRYGNKSFIEMFTCLFSLITSLSVVSSSFVE